MLIDWFTLGAQIINFLILVLLLRRFLYRPVIRAMSEREAKIAAQLNEARMLKQEVIDEAEAYRKKREELDNYRDALLSEAREDVEKWRKNTISKARADIDEARTSWHKSIVAEKQAFIQELRQRIGSQVCTISRQALAELADTELEQQMISVFMRQLRELDEAQRALLKESVQRSNYEISLHSAFILSPETRQSVLQTIRNSIGVEIGMKFEVIPDMLCGVEIISQDLKLAWTLDDYLISLEEKLFEAFDEVMEPEQHV